eukprot:8966016-Alexandrium_andersonii.AAC.1
MRKGLYNQCLNNQQRQTLRLLDVRRVPYRRPPQGSCRHELSQSRLAANQNVAPLPPVGGHGLSTAVGM